MKRVRAFTAITTAVLTFATVSSGAEILYNVDLSGIDDFGSGHTLRVAGTITVETATNAITGSDLTFFHHDDDGVLFPALPEEDRFATTPPRLITSPTELWFETMSGVPLEGSSIGWRTQALRSRYGFSLTSGRSPIQITYDPECPGIQWCAEAVFLYPEPGEAAYQLAFDHRLENGPTSPRPRFLLGTTVLPLSGDCSGNQSLDANDLACVASIEERDAVLEALNTLPGDLDGNGDVSFSDFLVLSENFGEDLTAYADGNIDLVDGVAFADFLLMSANFGATPSGVTVAPEPTGFSALGYATVGVVALVGRRR